MSGLLDPLAYGSIQSGPEEGGGGRRARSTLPGGAGVARDQAPWSLGWS